MKKMMLSFRFIFFAAGTFLCFLNFSFVSYLPDNGNEWKFRKEHMYPLFHGTNQEYTQVTVQMALPNNKACDGYDGIYHIAMTDVLGGVGTALIQLVLGQIMYAEQNNLKPWVHLSNLSQVFYDPSVHSQGGVRFKAMVGRNATYVAPSRQNYRSWRDFVPGPPNSSLDVTQQSLFFQGTGVWDHYFLPVSDFVPGDRSCEKKLYVTMDLYLITPGIHGFSNKYATRSWRYDYLPEYITQPHIPLHEWLLPQRQRAHKILTKYLRFRPFLHEMAARANPHCNTESHTCLGMHIRHSDKAAGRRQIDVVEFLPYAKAFVDLGGKQIYLATDSTRVLLEIMQKWPQSVSSKIRTLGQAIRSESKKAVFDMASHHRTNQEALVEILALSNCQFMVHGLSALSESSIWINPELHYRSVNLEDPDHLNETSFAVLVKQSFAIEPLDRLPRPPQTDKWWNRLTNDINNVVPNLSSANEDNLCDGFKGVLHIAHVAKGAASGRAFFTSILNQLLFAEHFGLKPWIHLSCESSSILHDSLAHAKRNFTVEASGYTLPEFSQGFWTVPFEVASFENPNIYQIPGCNIWDLYFEQLLSFPRGARSCASKPVFTLTQELITDAMEQRTAWSVRAWRYDHVQTSIWNPDGETTLQKIMWPMRVKGNKVTAKYYQLRRPIVEQAEKVNPIQTGDICLAVHIRAAGKEGKYRKRITADKYIEYMEAFSRSGGNVIYIATDSSRALNYLLKTVPDSVKKIIRHQGKYVVRSSSKTVPSYVLDRHHRVNAETLVDIYAMSRCHVLLHSSSTVSEAAIYLNLNLHNTSVNLEDPERMSIPLFENRVKRLMKK